MSRVLVYDLELAEDPDELGWAAALRGECGMSIGVIYDTSTQRPYLYRGPEVHGMADHLEYGDLVVGFNSIAFDLPVIESLTGRNLNLVSHLDLLKSITKASGTRKGYSLSALGERCLNRPKDSDGKAAIKMFKQGHWVDLISYCMSDVYLTRDLYNYILTHKYVISPDGAQIPLEIEAHDLI